MRKSRVSGDSNSFREEKQVMIELNSIDAVNFSSTDIKFIFKLIIDGYSVVFIGFKKLVDKT